MANWNTKWYLNYGNGSTTGYFAVAAWQANHSYSLNALVRPTAPSVGNERVFLCKTAGTSANPTEPTWPTGKGGVVATDGTVTWYEVTGQPAVNGDATNTPAWQATTSTSVGQIIKNTANTFLFISTSAGTTGSSEPTWNTTTGASTTGDGGVNWQCLGSTSTFSAWAAPHARLANAWTSGWATAGDAIFTSNHHAETQSSAMTLTSPGTAGNPTLVVCSNDSAAPPTATATGATISTTGASTITMPSGYAYVYGVSFKAGSSSNAANITFSNTGGIGWLLDSCNLTLNNTSGSSVIGVGSNNSQQYHVWTNTTVTFGSASQSIRPIAGRLYWYNTASAIGGTTPTTLFIPTVGNLGVVVVSGVDLSALGSGKNLVSFANNSCALDLYFSNCKLGTSVSVPTGTIGSQGNTRVFLDNCDSTSTNYRMEHYKYQGSIKWETTHVRSSGGASDGTTAISHNFTSLSTGPTLFSPLEGPWMTIWNDTSGSSKTLTVELCTENVVLTNGDVYLEVEYLGTSGFPESVYANSRVADIFTATSNLNTSGVSWSGFTTPKPQNIALTFTPQSKGPIRARICVIKANATVYVDPLLTVV